MRPVSSASMALLVLVSGCSGSTTAVARACVDRVSTTAPFVSLVYPFSGRTGVPINADSIIFTDSPLVRSQSSLVVGSATTRVPVTMYDLSFSYRFARAGVASCDRTLPAPIGSFSAR